VDFALQQHIGPFIYVSSVGVYGTIPKEIPAATNQPLHPDNYYHRSKAKAEEIVAEKLAGKLPFVILRPTISYGERDNGFLPRLISMVQKKKFLLSRNPIQIHLLNVKLLANAVLQILEKEAGYDQVFNAADSEPVFLSEVVDLIYEFRHRKSFPRILTSPHLFFQIGESIIHLAGLRQLETSIKLISNSWTYVVEPFHRTFCTKAPGTLETIRELLMDNNG
jgi:nucleoside-diphosphate-sugar epimerase